MAVSVGVLGVIFAWSLLRQGRLFTAGFHLIGGAVVTASILGSDLARVLYDSPPESAGTGEVVTASWKTWVFSGPVPLAPVLIGSAAVLALIRNLRWDRFARAFGAGAVAVFAVVLPWLSRAVLTGDPGTSKVKDSAVEFAETIHPWRFPVVLLVLATGAIVFGLGLDTLLTRPLAHRRARRRAERAERSRPTESG